MLGLRLRACPDDEGDIEDEGVWKPGHIGSVSHYFWHRHKVVGRYFAKSGLSSALELDLRAVTESCGGL